MTRPALTPIAAEYIYDPHAGPYWYAAAVPADDFYPVDEDTHVWECDHQHPTREAAFKCAFRYTEKAL